MSICPQVRSLAMPILQVRPPSHQNNIQKAIADFTGGTPQVNDLTLMVIGRKA